LQEISIHSARVQEAVKIKSGFSWQFPPPPI
jgi:hypothetical protein